MNIAWHFADESLFYQDGADEVRALIWRENRLYHAEVHTAENFGGWLVVAEKNDASLVEIICWAEEELKFRMAHEK